MRFLTLVLFCPLIACGGDIFTRDGLTDGDTFFLAPMAYQDDDPAFQSWVTFSLIRSTCKLEMGGENPARNSSFDCEFKARRHLVSSWEEKRQVNPGIRDKYLDMLADVDADGFLAEYTAHFHGKKHWLLPEGIRLREFRDWRRKHLRGHRPKTRLIGSWNYSRP